MKKLLLFGLGVVASLGSLTSCKKDEAVAAPTITFLNGVNSYTAKEVDTAYTFVADVEAAGEISSIKIFDVTVEGIETQVSSITKFDSDTKHEIKYTVKLSEVDNFKKFKISVTDKKDMSYSASFLINAYTKPAGDINSFTATLLGSQYASTGSFFSTKDGQVYTVATSAASSSLIDLIYYYSGGNGATIGGADDTNILGVYTGIANWTTKNATRFATTTMTTTEFDALTNDAKISTLSTFADTKEIGLTVGSVIAFKTAGGKKGVLKVTNLTKGTNTQNQQQDFQFGTIEIEVKVQK